jgi:hypothetical protein
MSRIQWRSVVIVAIRLVITLLFVPAILVKLRNPGTWLIHGPRIAAAYPGTIFVLVGVLTWLQLVDRLPYFAA